jgi:ribonuclease D
LAADLVASGKWDWAQQEFAALAAGVGVSPDPRPDPWRRTSGIHKVRTRRGLAYVAELWYARDDIAQRLDRAPGRILPDLAISDLAAAGASHDGGTHVRSTLRQIPAFLRRQAKRFEANWLQAIEAAASLRDADLPPMHLPAEGPPQPRLWAAKDPEAAARLARVRDALTAKAAELSLPVENLLTPDYVRRLAWQPPSPPGSPAVDSELERLGARPWQRELTVGLISPLLA